MPHLENIAISTVNAIIRISIHRSTYQSEVIMPFAPGVLAERATAIRERQRKARWSVVMAATQQAEREALAERLKVEFPDVPQHHTLRLWKLATTLTDRLIDACRRGDSPLEVSDDEYTSLFVEESFAPGTMMYVVRTDRDYATVLTAMAKSYNDIGQAFTIKHLAAPEWRREYQDPRSRVTATAPAPSDEVL